MAASVSIENLFNT